MDHLFNAFVSRRTNSVTQHSSSCGDKQPVYVSKKRLLKRTSFGSVRSHSSPSHSDCAKNTTNSELVDVVDQQLMQIREKLAKFREQDTQLRERMGSLSGSVNELASRSSLSSFTPSECSDLGSLDEVRSCEEEEECEQTIGQLRASVKSGHSNQPPVRCFHMRRTTSDPSSMYSHAELPEEEAMESQRYSTYSADQAINLYPHYNDPEEISTLF